MIADDCQYVDFRQDVQLSFSNCVIYAINHSGVVRCQHVHDKLFLSRWSSSLSSMKILKSLKYASPYFISLLFSGTEAFPIVSSNKLPPPPPLKLTNLCCCHTTTLNAWISCYASSCIGRWSLISKFNKHSHVADITDMSSWSTKGL